jgi:carbon storage regulator CsrA
MSLALGRRAGESIEVDGPARITVVEIRGNYVRLSIDADKSVAIRRDDMHNPFQTPREDQA